VNSVVVIYFAEHDDHAATLLKQRVLAFLG
jgi:hypothetical protein